jgi:hypothetical protein
VTAEAITMTTTTVYYEPLSLAIAYGLAILFNAISVMIGSFALLRSGMSHDASVSTFAIAMPGQ